MPRTIPKTPLNTRLFTPRNRDGLPQFKFQIDAPVLTGSFHNLFSNFGTIVRPSRHEFPECREKSSFWVRGTETELDTEFSY
jgi:hypothetical protein